MKKKNPFSQFLNHKLLHKIGKQWVVISATLIMFLSGGAVMAHSVNASRLNSTPAQAQVIAKPTQEQTISQSAPITQNAEQMHQKLLQNRLASHVNHQVDQTNKAPQDWTAYHYQRSTRYRKSKNYRNQNNGNKSNARKRSPRRQTKRTRRHLNKSIRHRSRKAQRNAKNELSVTQAV